MLTYLHEQVQKLSKFIEKGENGHGTAGGRSDEQTTENYQFSVDK